MTTATGLIKKKIDDDNYATVFRKSQAFEKHFKSLLARDEYLEYAGKLVKSGEIENNLFNLLTDLRSALENVEYKATAFLPEPYKTQVKSFISDEIKAILASASENFKKVAQQKTNETIN